jgi:hypothetical protein
MPDTPKHGCAGLDINCPICEGTVYRERANDREMVASIELWYPRVAGNVTTIEVGLMDVRAADSIRISYDFDRDGYVIKQASRFSWTSEQVDAGDLDDDWQEVAFIRAWAREVEEDDGSDVFTVKVGVPR